MKKMVDGQLLDMTQAEIEAHETEVDTNPLNQYVYRRKINYPDVTDQIGAIMKFVAGLRQSGMSVSTEIDNEIDDLISDIEQVKSDIPKNGGG